MSLFKRFRKVIAVMVIAVMSVISLPIGSVLEAASSVTLDIKCNSGEYGWVYVADANNNPAYKYTFTFTGNSSDIANLRIDKSIIHLNSFNATVKIFPVEQTATKVVGTLQLTDLSGAGINKSVTMDIIVNGVKVGTATSTPFTIRNRDYNDPYLVLGNPTPNTVYKGETVTMTIAACDDVAVKTFNITEDSIVLNGFTADKKLSGTGNFRTLTLSNIQGTVGQKSIYVSRAILADTYGNIAEGATSNAFTLAEKTTNTNPTNTNDNDNSNTNNNNANNNTGTNAGNIVINNNVIVNSRPADWVENPYTGL